MSEGKCPKCGNSYSEGTNICLLCGSELPLIPITPSMPSEKKQKADPVEVESMNITEGEAVPPFDDTGGFSKKVSKKEQRLEQLQVDNETLRKELDTFEEIYKREHPKGKPWYGSFGTWFALFLAIGCLCMIYWWVETEGGIPHEFYDLIRRIFR